jgi:hypothetical protein
MRGNYPPTFIGVPIIHAMSGQGEVRSDRTKTERIA